MTPEQQRIKIAEVHGYIRDEAGDCWQKDGLCYFVEDPHHLKQLPNYLNDLNAMHEAEKACLTTIPLVTDYGIRLVNALHKEHKKNPRIQDTSWRIPVVGNCGWFATATQRAEAFLKTLNLWTEE